MAALLLDVVGAAALLLGLGLATIGLYGMLRRPAVFDQLHAAGVVTGPSIVLVLLASVASGSAEIITSAALVILFVLITSPLSGHAIAQAAWRRDRDALRQGRRGDSSSNRPS
jgi:monovalent cation/proton antiporter MnhG/PhaG subunit